MRDEMVMRSVYLRPDEDSALRQLAFEIKVTKSDLIRSAISAKLVEWLKGNDPQIIIRDLERGRRLTPTERAEQARAKAAAPVPAAAGAKPKAAGKGAASVNGADGMAKVAARAAARKARPKAAPRESAPKAGQRELAGM